MYMVSNVGDIITIDNNHIKSQHKDKDGYYVCSLMCDSNTQYKAYPYRVHRIVAWEFCKNRDMDKVVNHMDGVVTNNTAINLEWTTVSGNTRHGYEHGNGRRGEEHYNSKYSEATVIKIITLINRGCANKEIRDILDSDNIIYSRNLIKDIRRKTAWKWLIAEYNKEGSTTIERYKDKYYTIDINLG